MLAIRLLRTGKKNQPFFRIVVTDKKNPPRGGRFLEIVGFYNPLTKERNLKQDRIKYWLSVGAKPSDTVHNLLVTDKIIEDKKIPVHKKTKKPSSASTSAEAPADKKATEGEEKPSVVPQGEAMEEKPKDKEEGKEKEEKVKEKAKPKTTKKKKEEEPKEAEQKPEEKPEEPIPAETAGIEEKIESSTAEATRDKEKGE
jgi:small subunit ribosomal protein S16